MLEQNNSYAIFKASRVNNSDRIYFQREYAREPCSCEYTRLQRWLFGKSAVFAGRDIELVGVSPCIRLSDKWIAEVTRYALHM